jgi:hypothetical protein
MAETTQPKKRGAHRASTFHDTVNTVVSLKRAGFSLAEIGQKLGFTKQTASYYFDLGTGQKRVCRCCGARLNSLPKSPVAETGTD